MTELGRLVRIADLRATWPDEARDFTPWLAQEENISLLSDFLGLGREGLEVETVERFVGPYRADILARNTADGTWVLIENQLERTDHSHLGQILTYAAGLDASLVIWVASHVAPEHAAALEWLNDLSGDEGPSFFAIEIELWRIGESPIAPRFNSVVRPNDWTRSATTAKKGIEESEISPLRQMQRLYWSGVEDLIKAGGGPLRPVKPQPESWIAHGIGKTGVGLNFGMNTREHWVRVEIYLSGVLAGERFHALAAHRTEIENALPYAIEWQELPEKTDCRIAVVLPDSDPTQEDDWPRQHAWLVEVASLVHTVFHPFVTELR